MRDRELADLPADVAVSQPELLAKGYCDYQRYRLTLTDTDGATHTQTRDILLAGKVVAVLPIDLVRDEIVLIRQFRLTASRQWPRRYDRGGRRSGRGVRVAA
jgi:ADP-ribose pyrophosphatase